MLQSVFYYLLMFDSLKNSGPALILLMIIPSPRFHFYIFTNFYESRVLSLPGFHFRIKNFNQSDEASRRDRDITLFIQSLENIQQQCILVPVLCDRCPLRLIYFSLPNRVKATEHNDPALSSIQLNEGFFFSIYFFLFSFIFCIFCQLVQLITMTRQNIGIKALSKLN